MRLWSGLGAITLALALLAGCSAEAEPESGGKSTAKPTETAEATVEAPATRTQKASCEWDKPRLADGNAEAPGGTDGDLAEALIGSWQHSHTDSGAGYEAVGSDIDIRYVFPSATRIVYCQDVPGATDKAENKAKLILKGPKLVLPGAAPGYTVMSWDENTMVWLNERSGSEKYLLKRR